MRFAWLRKKAGQVSVKQGFTQGLTHTQVYIRMAFSAAFWISLLFPFVGIIDYRAGFIAFFVVTVTRLGAHLYRVNVLAPERADFFPLQASPYLL